MPHGIYDERGELLQSTESELAAFTFALLRQKSGKLTTMLMADGAEVVFPPRTPAGKRAETAVEYRARVNAAVKEEMDKPAGKLLSFNPLEHEQTK